MDAPRHREGLAQATGPITRSLARLANMMIALLVGGFAGAIVAEPFLQLGYAAFRVFWIVTACIVALAIVAGGPYRLPATTAPSRTASLARAAYRGIIYSELGAALTSILPSLTSPMGGWRSADDRWMTLWVFSGIAVGATLMIAGSELGGSASHGRTAGKGVAIGVLGAPVGIALARWIPWLDLSIIPVPMRTFLWACGCAIGGALITLLIRHWRELIRSRHGSLSFLAGRGFGLVLQLIGVGRRER